MSAVSSSSTHDVHTISCSCILQLNTLVLLLVVTEVPAVLGVTAGAPLWSETASSVAVDAVAEDVALMKPVEFAMVLGVDAEEEDVALVEPVELAMVVAVEVALVESIDLTLVMGASLLVVLGNSAGSYRSTRRATSMPSGVTIRM
jgi:predicted mannosyl-3-phosphoglycerate phosphatase (HAD superfamily)